MLHSKPGQVIWWVSPSVIFTVKYLQTSTSSLFNSLTKVHSFMQQKKYFKHLLHTWVHKPHEIRETELRCPSTPYKVMTIREHATVNDLHFPARSTEVMITRYDDWLFSWWNVAVTYVALKMHCRNTALKKVHF